MTDSATGTGIRSVRSGAIVVAGRGVQLALQLGVLAILSRLLTPEDYGVAAYVFPVALLVQNISNSGLQSAIIQHAGLTDVESSALFWASLRWNAWLALAMAATGPVIALVYRDASAAPLTAAWAVVIFLATLSAIHEARLKRDFRFGSVLGAHLTAQVLSVAVAIWAALNGARYWTFIIQMAVVELGRVVIIWMIHPWRPMAPGRLGDAREAAIAELRSYWRGFAGSRLVGWIGEQADRIAVGTLFGRASMGFYEAAKRWGTFAFLEPYIALTEVAVAGLSRVRDDPARFALYVRNAFLPVLGVSLPIVGFLFAEPRGVLGFLLGDQWLEAAPMLRAISLAIAIGSIGRLALWVSLATGGTAHQLRWMLLATPVYLAAVVVGSLSGPPGVAIGVVVANVLTSVPAVYYLFRPVGLSPRAVLPVWGIPFAASAAGVVALQLMDGVLPAANGIVGLVVRGIVFLSVYAVGWVLAPGGLAMLRAARFGGSKGARAQGSKD